MGFREIVVTGIVLLLSSFISIFILFRMFLAFVTSPFTFGWKKNQELPACLQDQSLGTHGFVHLEEVRLHYVAAGDEKKPLMLFLHGFPEFWYSWRYQLKEFQKDYRVVAVDQRGYGESDAPPGIMKYAVSELANDIKQLIPALGYKSCVLVGHDWGGVVAWTVAGVYPHLVDKLVIMNSPHPLAFNKYLMSHKPQMKKSWYMAFFYMPFLPELYMCMRDRKLLTVAFTGRAMGLKVTRLAPEDVQAYKYAYPKLASFTGPINYIRAMARSVLPRMKKITCPTLLLWGCQDGALETGLASASTKYAESISVKYIDESSHWVQMDCPDKVNDYMKEFLT